MKKRSKGVIAHSVLLFSVVVLFQCFNVFAYENLNRIATRVVASEVCFYDTVTKEEFIPNGYNYTELDGNYPERHLAFNVTKYDNQKIEAMLGEMQNYGHNVVRVFIDPGNAESSLWGVGGDPNTYTRGLYSPYMDNVCDFINRSRNHNIYVIPVLCYVPQNSYYVGLGESDKPANVEDVNLYLLSKGYINAKRQYLTDFVSYIKNKDNTLLSTILAYSIENEFCILGDKKPFIMRSGTIYPANGLLYDMSNEASRQNCYDDGIRYYVDQIKPGATGVDPNAKIMLGTFTNYAVGREGSTGVMWSVGQDNRFPIRPFALSNVSNSLDIIDIHLYPVDQTIDTDLASIEWNKLNRGSKPFILGEYGAHTSIYSDITEASIAMVNYRNNALSNGIKGSLYWTWNNCGQPLYAAKDGNNEIRNALSNLIS